MAISSSSFREIEERMMRARSAEEYHYFAEKLRYYEGQRYSMMDTVCNPPTVMREAVAATPAVSFNKRLLLTVRA